MSAAFRTIWPGDEHVYAFSFPPLNWLAEELHRHDLLMRRLIWDGGPHLLNSSGQTVP